MEIKRSFWPAGLQTSQKEIGKIVKKDCNRVVTGNYAKNGNHLSGGPGYRCRPDGVAQMWETVISDWELKSNYHAKKDTERAVAEGMSSEVFNMHENPLVFLRVFTAVMFLDKEYLGFNPSISVRCPGGGARSLTVAGKSYVIEEQVVEHPADYWPDVTRGSTEIEFLNAARDVPGGIKGVCKLVDEELVRFRGAEDMTDLIRPPAMKEKVMSGQHCQLHRHLVLQPFAVPITHFATKQELISAFIDVIQDDSGCQRGLLIDLNYALWYSEDHGEMVKERKVGQAERHHAFHGYRTPGLGREIGT
ncbi:hypothetical protein GLOTRDRAFT_92190 [Gloeophyllum trabeum ATCC 11539]|uniref:Fungal-type protein kinase domain-containing protein n=1 Tax=Gloeophyllum trabeum (strain ATCC 11539 / FP-39264 / Madison 617) TaxID=670483 RepID=S7QAV7_GLOTA|nr:uncharacterized protein GLOTRDRAFT_92190 [Gloeophyllum trabeum ATCC 11539]EPQ57036.1 hypothetical protein GLOTRDRAFT_92190 [Gloeophyllum trabeum ATCC 11539]